MWYMHRYTDKEDGPWKIKLSQIKSRFIKKKKKKKKIIIIWTLRFQIIQKNFIKNKNSIVNQRLKTNSSAKPIRNEK